MRRLSPILGILAILGVLAPAEGAVAGAPSPEITYKKGTITIAQSFRRISLQVEVADTPESRAQGLMHRKHLDENAGMLFIFEETSRGGFWMKNTLIPLSIAFMDEKWVIVDIKDMKVAKDPTGEGPFVVYSSAKPYRYALEVNEGFFARRDVTIGAKARYVPLKP